MNDFVKGLSVCVVLLAACCELVFSISPVQRSLLFADSYRVQTPEENTEESQSDATQEDETEENDEQSESEEDDGEEYREIPDEERTLIKGNVMQYEEEEYVYNDIITDAETGQQWQRQIQKKILTAMHECKDQSIERKLVWGVRQGITSIFVYGYRKLDSGEYQGVGGAIYDMDDKYIYILTANQALGDLDEHSAFSEVSDKLMLQYGYTNEMIVPLYIKKSDADHALIVVDKNAVSKEMLSSIRTINTEYLYQSRFSESSLGYGCYSDKFIHSDGGTALRWHMIVEYIPLGEELGGDILIDHERWNEENFSPGEVLFDEDGNFAGIVVDRDRIAYSSVFPDFYNMIVDFNPDYGERIRYLKKMKPNTNN